MFRNLGARPRTTWIPSFVLKTQAGSLEADLGILWDGGDASRGPPQLILAECKTFGPFKSLDLRRVRALASFFPGAVMVFATFRDALESSERRAIGKLARWGRKAWRCPVMVLTARELTSDLCPPYCWHHGGSDRERGVYESVTRAPAPFVSLRRLADATQQLYLDMSPDAGWPHYEVP